MTSAKHCEVCGGLMSYAIDGGPECACVSGARKVAGVMTDLTTADLDRIEADANSPGVDTWGDEHCVMRVSEVNALLSMARQVATIRDETLEEAAKYHDNLAEYQMRQADDAKTASSRTRWLQSATINQSHAENIRALKVAS